MPRLDSYSTGDYGDTVRVFRIKPGGPFYSEIQRVVKVIKLPGKRRIWNARDAKQWARDRHRDIRAGESDVETLDAIFNAYLEHRSPVKATAQGKKDDQRRAAMWKAVLGATRDPLSITRGDLESFIQKRGYKLIDAHGRGVMPHATGWNQSARLRHREATGGRALTASRVRPRTVHADLQWLRSVLYWSLGDRCPMRPVKLADVARDLHQSAEPRRPVATQDRYEAIMKYLDERGRGHAGEPGGPGGRQSDRSELAAVPPYLRELLVLVNGTGHRLSEILSLKYADIGISATGMTLRWRSENVGNKARLERVVPVSPSVQAMLEQIQRERPGIGEAWLFPGLRNPKHPTHRSVADKWLRQAEKAAGLAPLSGSLWHAYRRKWATEKKHLPDADVAFAGGWKNARTLQTVYQQSDPAGVLRVVLDQTELREERG